MHSLSSITTCTLPARLLTYNWHVELTIKNIHALAFLIISSALHFAVPFSPVYLGWCDKPGFVILSLDLCGRFARMAGNLLFCSSWFDFERPHARCVRFCPPSSRLNSRRWCGQYDCQWQWSRRSMRRSVITLWYSCCCIVNVVSIGLFLIFNKWKKSSYNLVINLLGYPIVSLDCVESTINCIFMVNTWIGQGRGCR